MREAPLELGMLERFLQGALVEAINLLYLVFPDEMLEADCQNAACSSFIRNARFCDLVDHSAHPLVRCVFEPRLVRPVLAFNENKIAGCGHPSDVVASDAVAVDANAPSTHLH